MHAGIRIIFVAMVSILMQASPILPAAPAFAADSAESLRDQAFSLFYGDTDQKARAIALFESAAAAGDTTSMVFLGGIYESGDGVVADRQQAIDWYVKAIAAGNNDATTKLARLASQAPTERENTAQQKPDATAAPPTTTATASAAEEEEQPAVDTEELLSQAKNAFDFDSTQNDEAIALFEQAATAGNGEAADWLTSIYYLPMGVSKPDYKKARKWGQQGADAGISRSMVMLAEMYGAGQGGPKDAKKYFQWMEKAADMYDVSAYFQLGNAYFNGVLVKPDYKKAFDYQLKAADMDNPDSNALIAFRYMHGDGTGKDAIRSARYLYRAIQFGSDFAKSNLGDYAHDRLVISHLQELLQDDGYYDGAIDGSMGGQTRAAIDAAFGTKKS